jgi:hypothetical protein
MAKTDDLPPLGDLATELPQRRIGVIKHLWPSVEACLAAGHTVRTIRARLAAEGLEIPYSTLCWAISTLKKGSHQKPQTALGSEGKQRASSRQVGDPLGNLHRANQGRPGFEYPGTLSDEELFGKK